MRVLVLYAHPVETSFGAAVHQTLVATLRKGGHADDCVVPPIVALRGMPPRDSCSYRRTVKPSGKLLQSRKQCARVDHDGQRLDQGYGRVNLQGGGKPDDGVPRHKAVGI